MNGPRKSFVSLSYKHLAPPALNKFALFRFLVAAALMVAGNILVLTSLSAQPRRRQRPAPPISQTQAPRASAAKYSAFLHSSEKHKSLSCNACHKIPTEWNAKRTFPDVADFPDHDACVRCHRQQFFTAQAFAGTGPAICTVCHGRAPGGHAFCVWRAQWRRTTDKAKTRMAIHDRVSARQASERDRIVSSIRRAPCGTASYCAGFLAGCRACLIPRRKVAGEKAGLQQLFHLSRY